MNLSIEEFDYKEYLSQLTTQPGVYRMYDSQSRLLYVGKARNLRKRVSSYFLRASGNPRIEMMVDQIRRIDVTITTTEDQALLLEATLIKELNPRYNIMLRDDKSYPYLKITDHAFPRIVFYRGSSTGADRYFGPFPSSQTVRNTLETLQKLFLLRPCDDSFFSHRKRPCLQYQIKRCSAPCTGLISQGDYAYDVSNAVSLLEGKAEQLADKLNLEMERAAQSLEYERAARLRDQIAALKTVQEARAINAGAKEIDVIAVAPHASSSCITVVSIRDGLNLGHRSFFPRHPPLSQSDTLLEAFIAQYYLSRPAPQVVLVSHVPENKDWLEHTLSEQTHHRIHVLQPQRGQRLRLLEMVIRTAEQALSTHLVESTAMQVRLAELQEVLHLDNAPQRFECFDISHTLGERAVASCVVFNEHGPFKSAYRKFNIEGITPGDDYAAIKQAITRRFMRVKAGETPAPDVLFIDGGQGQLNAALEALADVGVDNLRLVAIAKGPTRKPGLEELILPELEYPLTLPADSPALHLIQRIRDEAHRFAITGHRGRREKARVSSSLENIEGLGPVRRRALLKTLGGLAQIKRVGIDELAKVEGINRTLAERIHAHFH
ncbi:MAG: excinuclease ABC subunit UvrC [Stenotrophobium sp.]